MVTQEFSREFEQLPQDKGMITEDAEVYLV